MWRLNENDDVEGTSDHTAVGGGDNTYDNVVGGENERDVTISRATYHYVHGEVNEYTPAGEGNVPLSTVK